MEPSTCFYKEISELTTLPGCWWKVPDSTGTGFNKDWKLDLSQKRNWYSTTSNKSVCLNSFFTRETKSINESKLLLYNLIKSRNSTTFREVIHLPCNFKYYILFLFIFLYFIQPKHIILPLLPFHLFAFLVDKKYKSNSYEIHY